MTTARLPEVHPCSGALAAVGRRLVATLASGLVGLVAGMTLGALGPDVRGAANGVAVGAPVSRDITSPSFPVSNGLPVDDDVSTSVATVIAPAAGLPVRDAGESAGGRR